MEKTQTTPINKKEYNLFKEFVADVHGSERGHLRTELENALREYRTSYYGEDRLARIEQDISTIMATVADAESDGGKAVPTRSEPSDTRPREMRKPAPNQPRSKKVEYLVGRYYERHNCNSETGVLIEKQVRSLVDDEYSFNDEIQQEYTDAVHDEIRSANSARPHPVHGKFRVWGDALESAQKNAEADADADLDELAD